MCYNSISVVTGCQKRSQRSRRQRNLGNLRSLQQTSSAVTSFSVGLRSCSPAGNSYRSCKAPGGGGRACTSPQPRRSGWGSCPQRHHLLLPWGSAARPSGPPGAWGSPCRRGLARGSRPWKSWRRRGRWWCRGRRRCGGAGGSWCRGCSPSRRRQGCRGSSASAPLAHPATGCYPGERWRSTPAALEETNKCL